MKFIKSLTEAEKITLLDASRYAPWARFRQRAHAVYLSGKRYRLEQLADIFDVDRDTVSAWLQAWENQGLLGLRDHPHPGRPSKGSAEDKQWLKQIVEESPHQLREVIEKYKKRTGRSLTKGTLIRWLKKEGLIWKRCRRSLKSYRDPERFHEGQRILKAFHNREKQEELDVYYLDESGLSSKSCVPYAWQAQGQTIELPANVKGMANVIGLINRNHQSYFEVVEGTVTHESVIHTINGFIETHVPKKLTIIVMDNAPIHKKAVKNAQWDWLAQKVWVWFLPPYSPELNPIEILWKQIKYFWLPWDAYKCFDVMKTALKDIFESLGQKYRINFA